MSTEVSFYIYDRPLTGINVVAGFWAHDPILFNTIRSDKEIRHYTIPGYMYGVSTVKIN